MDEWLGSVLIAALVSAAISSLVTVFGWFATFRNQVKIDALRRQERVLDTQSALIAEIRSNLFQFAGIDLDDLELTVLRAIGQGTRRSPYTPFVPKYSHMIVFETILDEINILPSEIILDVVLYYKLEYKLSHFADDLRGEAYARLEPERKQLMYADYVEIIRSTQRAGRAALRALETSIHAAR